MLPAFHFSMCQVPLTMAPGAHAYKCRKCFNPLKAGKIFPEVIINKDYYKVNFEKPKHMYLKHQHVDVNGHCSCLAVQSSIVSLSYCNFVTNRDLSAGT